MKAEVDFSDIERLDYREACEVAFNAHPIYTSLDTIERNRLYRYNAYLEWNAGRRISGMKQEQPPSMHPLLDRPLRLISIEKFIMPIYRHLKLIEGHLRELTRLSREDLHAFSADSTKKSPAESYMLKAIQSAILITMSVMHRSMRLAARDYRDLFLLMPVFGIASRERAGRMAKCADIRDKLMFI